MSSLLVAPRLKVFPPTSEIFPGIFSRQTPHKCLQVSKLQTSEIFSGIFASNDSSGTQFASNGMLPTPIWFLRNSSCDNKERNFTALPEEYEIFDAENPIVTCKQCFDDLRLPPEHPGRSKSDTYYIIDDTLLRTHTSAHQSQTLRDTADSASSIAKAPIIRTRRLGQLADQLAHRKEKAPNWFPRNSSCDNKLRNSSDPQIDSLGIHLRRPVTESFRLPNWFPRNSSCINGILHLRQPVTEFFRTPIDSLGIQVAITSNGILPTPKLIPSEFICVDQ